MTVILRFERQEDLMRMWVSEWSTRGQINVSSGLSLDLKAHVILGNFVDVFTRYPSPVKPKYARRRKIRGPTAFAKGKKQYEAQWISRTVQAGTGDHVKTYLKTRYVIRVICRETLISSASLSK
ncbi:hypothetical protein EJ06DRAFT_519392 [Trichodelitschia bisporula]|uniref:Uncharacterized protein n=1 Tax=Trichodelitschia bisporula TaxID=703511 RepID=A0A6G1I5S3_9PEZI|nr:hypothetical protein EJ06DRAFT_519392 [Trichodelitschia bisporula]